MAKVDPAWPVKGANAGRDCFDASVAEAEAERMRQAREAARLRRDIERIRREWHAETRQETGHA